MSDQKKVGVRIAKVVDEVPSLIESDVIYIVRKGDGFDLHVSGSDGDIVEAYSLNAEITSREVRVDVDDLTEKVGYLEEHLHDDFDVLNRTLQGLSPINLRVVSDAIYTPSETDTKVEWSVVKQSNSINSVEAGEGYIEFSVEGLFTFKTDIVVTLTNATDPVDIIFTVVDANNGNAVVSQNIIEPNLFAGTPQHISFNTIVESAEGMKIEVYVKKVGDDEVRIENLSSYMLSQSAGSNVTINDATENIAGIVRYGTTAGTAAQGNDSRLSDSREWTAGTISQAEAEAGTATTRRAFTAQRVRHAIVAWWNGITGAFGRDLVASASDSDARSKLGLHTSATRWPTWSEVTSKPSTFSPSSHTHPLSQITDVGDLASLSTNANTSNFLRGDGTWATPPNTTYAAMSAAEGDAGTSTTLRTMRADNLRQIISKIPPLSKTGAYTAVANDRGKGIDTTGDVTIPAGVFSVGDVLVVTNTSSTEINIIPASGVVLRKAGTETIGTITLSGYGMATMRMVTSDHWFISGAGIK